MAHIGIGLARSSGDSRSRWRSYRVIHTSQIRCARLVFALAALLCVLTAPALGDDRPWEQARWLALNTRFSPNGEEFSSGQRWLESQLHSTQRHGFEYSRSLSLNPERNVVFSIQGPFVGDRAPGLAFEFRY
jgi:hypothetical protein